MLFRSFPSERIYWIISDQLLRSATSIGANIIEAKAASSKKDFIRFYEISLKSANETKYWLCLLRDGTRIDKAIDDTYNKLNNVPKENLKQMFVPRMFYSGWQSGHYSNEDFTIDTCFPLNGFFSLYNSFTRDTQGNTGIKTAVNNEWRWKGTQIGRAHV